MEANGLWLLSDKIYGKKIFVFMNFMFFCYFIFLYNVMSILFAKLAIFF